MLKVIIGQLELDRLLFKNNYIESTHKFRSDFSLASVTPVISVTNCSSIVLFRTNMTFWTGMANSHICPGQVSQSWVVGQICLSLDKYGFKFRNNSNLALNCLDQWLAKQDHILQCACATLRSLISW